MRPHFHRFKKSSLGLIVGVLGSSMALVPWVSAAIPTTTRVSVSESGAQGTAEMEEPSMSADGRFVAFTTASALVAGDTNNAMDIYVRDRATDKTFLVTPGADGASTQPSISPDGRWIAYVSKATNLVSKQDFNGATGDVLLSEWQAGKTVRVSSPTPESSKVSNKGQSFDPSVSDGGNWVAFTSLDKSFDKFLGFAQQTNDVHDVLLWERAKGSESIPGNYSFISLAGDGTQGNRQSQNPMISADGNTIAFTSDASNLAGQEPAPHYNLPLAQPGDPAFPARTGTDVFVWKRGAGISRATNGPGGAEPNEDASFVPAISANGNRVAYMSDASNLELTNGADTNNLRDTFVYDIASKETTRVSVRSDGKEQNCVPATTGPKVGQPAVGDGACASFEAPVLSADGRYVAFMSGANNLVEPDANVTGRDVFVHDMTTKETTRVSNNSAGLQANAGSTGSAPDIDGSGRYIAFESNATNLVEPDGNAVADIYVHDRTPDLPAPYSGAPPVIPPIGGGGGGTTLPPAGVGQGYWLVASDGGIFAFGADFKGSTGDITLNKPIVGMTNTPTGNGYWLVASDGGIFSFGDAAFFGSTGAMKLNKPIVGMAPTPSGKGYWLVASDGGIFSFGDAAFHGSTGALTLNKPVVGMAATPGGKGYWLVASDGGIFAFGDAVFFGSTGAMKLNKPIEGMAASRTGKGYWLVASDGGIFAFGDAAFHGSTGAITLNKPIKGMAATRSGKGYWLVASDGGIFSFGDAAFQGSTGAMKLNKPIVGMAQR